MTRREQEALPALLALIVVLLTMGAVFLIMWGAQRQDEIDQRAMEQAKAHNSATIHDMAQLDAQGRAMAGYDEIKQRNGE